MCCGSQRSVGSSCHVSLQGSGWRAVGADNLAHTCGLIKDIGDASGVLCADNAASIQGELSLYVCICGLD